MQASHRTRFDLGRNSSFGDRSASLANPIYWPVIPLASMVAKWIIIFPMNKTVTNSENMRMVCEQEPQFPVNGIIEA